MIFQKERTSNHCVTGKIIQGNVEAMYIILKQQYILLITLEAGRMEISDSSALLTLRYPLQEHSSTPYGINATIKVVFK